MKSKCGKLKIKGHIAEYRIDNVLTSSFLDDVFGWSRKRNSKQVEMITALRQAKTCIQSLNSMIKTLNEKIDDMWDTIEDCEGEISQLRKEKQKLKDELSDCIMSNELIEREYNRLMEELKERK